MKFPFKKVDTRNNLFLSFSWARYYSITIQKAEIIFNNNINIERQN